MSSIAPKWETRSSFGCGVFADATSAQAVFARSRSIAFVCYGPHLVGCFAAGLARQGWGRLVGEAEQLSFEDAKRGGREGGREE